MSRFVFLSSVLLGCRSTVGDALALHFSSEKERSQIHSFDHRNIPQDFSPELEQCFALEVFCHVVHYHVARSVERALYTVPSIYSILYIKVLYHDVPYIFPSQ